MRCPSCLHLFAGCAIVASAGVKATAQSVITTFELPDIRTAGGTAYLESALWYKTIDQGEVLDGWTVMQESVDVVHHLANTALKGSQSVDLNGFGPGILKRTFPTVPGTLYRLSFDFSGNPIDGRERVLEVRWNGAVAGTYTWDPVARGNSFHLDMKWESKAIERIADGTLATIELISLRNGASGPQLDNLVFGAVSKLDLTVQHALLLTWPAPEGGIAGAVLEDADRPDGPWKTVQNALLQLTSNSQVAATVPTVDVSRFYRVRLP